MPMWWFHLEKYAQSGAKRSKSEHTWPDVPWNCFQGNIVHESSWRTVWRRHLAVEDFSQRTARGGLPSWKTSCPAQVVLGHDPSWQLGKVCDETGTRRSQSERTWPGVSWNCLQGTLARVSSWRTAWRRRPNMEDFLWRTTRRGLLSGRTGCPASPFPGSFLVWQHFFLVEHNWNHEWIRNNLQKRP